MRYWFSVRVAKMVYSLLRLLKRSGTALPGLILLKLNPDFISQAAQGLRVVLVSGTNGKTTTTHLLSQIVAQTGDHVISNRSGSNLSRGVAWTLLEAQTLRAQLALQAYRAEFSNSPRPKPNQVIWAILECDEAALPAIAAAVQPELILLLNLFRDQIDRYGEVDVLVKRWQKMLNACTGPVAVVANADDPGLVIACANNPTTVYFGLEDPELGVLNLHTTADAVLSPLDGSKLQYSKVFYSHLGWYQSIDGQFSRPNPIYQVSQAKLHGLEATQFTLSDQSGLKLGLQFPLPGVYNLYNALAAVTAAIRLEIKPELIQSALAQFEAAFGRMERLTLPDSSTLTLLLAKNPTGFDQVIDLLRQQPITTPLIIAINDLIADGQDISWLWDVNFEQLVLDQKAVIVSGTRSADLGLRLLYAGLQDQQIIEKPELTVADLQSGPPGQRYAILSYTAMLAVRELLYQQGIVQQSCVGVQK